MRSLADYVELFDYLRKSGFKKNMGHQKGSVKTFFQLAASNLEKPSCCLLDVRSFPFSHIVNAAVARHRGQDNMAAAAGRYYGEGGRATKRQKTEDGGMTTVRVSFLHW